MAGDKRLQKIFDSLLAAYGTRHWWPGETPFEVMVGAVLTQNTSWRNVEKAISALKRQGAMNLPALAAMEEEELAEIIRSAGFYNVKARRLKNLIRFIGEKFNGKIESMAQEGLPGLRDLLLGINGLGPETADSILLYALQKPVFVVDAYTKRFLSNHGLYHKSTDYHEIQRYFQERLAPDTYLYNEFHALIVVLCQTYCRKQPLCDQCPLGPDLDGKGVRHRRPSQGTAT